MQEGIRIGGEEVTKELAPVINRQQGTIQEQENTIEIQKKENQQIKKDAIKTVDELVEAGKDVKRQSFNTGFANAVGMVSGQLSKEIDEKNQQAIKERKESVVPGLKANKGTIVCCSLV